MPSALTIGTFQVSTAGYCPFWLAFIKQLVAAMCFHCFLFFVFCLQVFVFLLHISGSLSVLNQRVLVNMLPDSGWGWRWVGVDLLAADYRFTFPNFSVRLSGSST